MKKLGVLPWLGSAGLVGTCMVQPALAQLTPPGYAPGGYVQGQPPGQVFPAPNYGPPPAAPMPPVFTPQPAQQAAPSSPARGLELPANARAPLAPGSTGTGPEGRAAPAQLAPGDFRTNGWMVTAGGLTSDQVAHQAEVTSFDAMARREALNAAEARLDQALVSFYPKLSFTARYSRLSPIENAPFSDRPILYADNSSASSNKDQGTPVPAGAKLLTIAPTGVASVNNQFLGQASLTVPLSDYILRISQSYASASHSQKAALIDEQAARLKAASDARLAYYAWLRAKAQVSVSQQAVAQARGHLVDDQSSFRAGSASRAEVLRAESQLGNAELVLARAVNLADLSEDQIRTAMHDTRQMTYMPGEDLFADLAPVGGIENLEALRAEAMGRRLEIRALDETVWSFAEQAKLAKAGNWPRLDGFGDLIYANPNPRYFPQTDAWHLTWDVGLQVTWAPTDVLTASGASAEARARGAQTEMQKAALRDAIRAEVLQAQQALREADVAVQTSARTLASADEGYRVRRELFKNGRSTSVDLSDSELEVFRARLEAINARADMRSARARLTHATGRDVPATDAR